MRRILLRLAAAFGVSAAVAFAVFFGLDRGSKLADFTAKKTHAPAYVTLPDGGHIYRTLTVPIACPNDGGECSLPDERVASCLASIKYGDLTLANGDDCIRGAVEPEFVVEWVGANHDDPSACDDEDICDGGAAVRIDPDPCACQTWPAAATCKLLDGGVAPNDKTLGPGQWTGAGCVRRACVVFSHGASGYDDGMPPECRRPDGGAP